MPIYTYYNSYTIYINTTLFHDEEVTEFVHVAFSWTF